MIGFHSWDPSELACCVTEEVEVRGNLPRPSIADDWTEKTAKPVLCAVRPVFLAVGPIGKYAASCTEKRIAVNASGTEFRQPVEAAYVRGTKRHPGQEEWP
jgi:hypothetical protein